MVKQSFPNLLRHVQACGDVGRFTAGRFAVVAINSATLTRVALGTHADAFEPMSPAHSVDGQLLSNAVVVKAVRTHGPRSVEHRRSFARIIRAHADAAAVFAERLCAGRKDGDPIGTVNDVVQLARWMMTRRVLHLDGMPDAADEIAGALTAYAAAARRKPPLLASTRWAIRRNRRYRNAIRQLRTSIRRTIARLNHSDALGDRDLVAALKEGVDAGGGAAGERQWSARLSGVLMLSVETAVTVMNVVWSELLSSPRVWIRMHEEVAAVLDGRTPRYHDLRRLRYTGNVVREVLRLHPPVAMFSRRVARDLQLGEHHIAAGSIVVFNPLAVHRSAECFPSPRVFEPDRFAAGDVSLATGSYMPFGADERSGVHRYALALTHIVLATIVQRLTAEPNRLASTMARGRLPRALGHREVGQSCTI
jgi:cytochrome P450